MSFPLLMQELDRHLQALWKKLGMMRLYHDNEGLGDEEKASLLGKKPFVEQIRGQRGVTLFWIAEEL